VGGALIDASCGGIYERRTKIGGKCERKLRLDERKAKNNEIKCMKKRRQKAPKTACGE
jgi:hypothetical protein